MRLGIRSGADAQWANAFVHMDLGGLNVWKETADGLGHSNFITGAGGFAQNVINGYAGGDLQLCKCVVVGSCCDNRRQLCSCLQRLPACPTSRRGSATLEWAARSLNVLCVWHGCRSGHAE